MKKILGIDIGTTNIKAALFDLNGKRTADASIPYPTAHEPLGWAEQQPQDWYDGVVKAVRTLLSAKNQKPGDVACVCLDGHIRSVAFFDRSFETVYPGIIWSDTRSAEIAKEMNGRYGSALTKTTGNRADTNYALPNIVWLQRNLPELWVKTAFLASPKDYVIQKLTGKFVSDASNQAGSLLVDLDLRNWSTDLLHLFGIRTEMLPVLRRSADLAGTITKQASLDTGLPTGVPVIVGGGDNDTAALGAGVCGQGTLSVSLGTAGIILAPLERPLRGASEKLDVFAHVVPSQWYAMGMLKSAGYALEWLKERSTELCGERVSTKAWFAQLQSGSEPLLPGSHGLFCFPYQQGRGNPDKDARAKAAFLGISAGHTLRHFAQASMEGVAYCVKQCADSIGDSAEIRSVVCCGGGAENPTWLQIIAAVLGRPVKKNLNAFEGALGAAMIGAAGIGLFPSIGEACAAYAVSGEEIIPLPEHISQYEKLYEQFCGLSDRLWTPAGETN